MGHHLLREQKSSGVTCWFQHSTFFHILYHPQNSLNCPRSVSRHPGIGSIIQPWGHLGAAAPFSCPALQPEVQAQATKTRIHWPVLGAPGTATTFPHGSLKNIQCTGETSIFTHKFFFFRKPWISVILLNQKSHPVATNISTSKFLMFSALNLPDDSLPWYSAALRDTKSPPLHLLYIS